MLRQTVQVLSIGINIGLFKPHIVCHTITLKKQKHHIVCS